MSDENQPPDWYIIGDWLSYRYGQFLVVLSALLLGWWIVTMVVQ